MKGDKELENIDLNMDGIISEVEITTKDKLVELKLKERKAAFNKRMAGIAIVAIILVVGVLLTPYIPLDRIKVIEPILMAFIWAMASLAGAVIGVTSWVQNK